MGSSSRTVYKNRNYGSINADINVGGIVGAMSIEYDIDPEDDILKKGTRSLNFKYLTTSILKNSINHGKVACKKDYVGGIAGYGNDISNSYSLIELKDGIEWVGSIAGQAEGEIHNNHFVHDSLAAIDGISYNGKASPINYNELLDIEYLPDAFSELYLTFIADGEIIEKISFQYGESFDLGLLPNIPKKDEHDSHWESFNHYKMTFNTTVEAIYNPFLTVISSNISRNEGSLPLLLAEGQFHTGVTLNVSPFNIDNMKFPIDDKKVLEAWNVELEDFEPEEDEVSTLRLLIPEEKSKATVWQYKNDSWKRLRPSMHGSYIVFDIDGSSGVFAIV